MTTTDTTVNNLIINKLTKAQYESIASPSSTELYMTTDEPLASSDVITALGYTPYNSTNPNGYTSNEGTVTAVNNISPVSGNVTLAYSDVGARAARTTVTDTTSTTITLANANANTDYHYGTLTSLTVTANDTSDEEITIYFTAGNSITVNLPATLEYIGEAPTFEINKSYAISILNNILVSGEVEA